MKKLLTMFLALLLAGAIHAQGPVEIKDVSGSGQKKFKKSPKRIYIAQFRVNYQLLYSQVEKEEGGRTLGGGYRGDAKAGLTMAVQGIEASDLIEITDRIYNDYLTSFKNEGYEIVSIEEASKAKSFEDWERKIGGTLNEAQYPGYITSVPTGFEYFVKKTKDSGREKSSFVDNSLKISGDMNVTVVKINIVVPFVEDAESGASKALGKAVGGLAKVVLRPYLRIEKDPVGTAGTFSTDAALTQATYAYKESAGSMGATYLRLKSNLDIPGIFEDKKYKAVESADTDLWGTQVGALTLFNVSDKYLAKTQPLPVDAQKYKQAVSLAASAYLKATREEYLSNAK
ncbi:MAG: hypothetical protein AB7O48_13610 [Cyclobacteriaceae bacterium]